MNYRKIYDELINRAKNRNISGYIEVHHIIPLCIGGSNTKDNLVELTAREHYVAHQLLHKIYPDNEKLLHAIQMMTVSNKRHNRSANRLYEWIRIKHSRRMSILHSGKNVSDETRKKMSIAAKKRSNNWTNRKHTEETKLKMSLIKKESTKGSGNSNAGTWKITPILGDSFIIKSLKTYCFDNRLSLYKMRNNKYNEYKVEKL